MSAIVDELPGIAPSIGQGSERPAILLESEAAEQENEDAEAEMAGHLHHDVGDVARADLAALEQEEARLHQKNKAAHDEQPQPINVGIHSFSPPGSVPTAAGRNCCSHLARNTQRTEIQNSYVGDKSRC